MGPLDLVRLTPLIDRTSGRPEISVGLIDGPVLLTHPELASENIREVRGKLREPVPAATTPDARTEPSQPVFCQPVEILRHRRFVRCAASSCALFFLRRLD
jgi:hypothetical protein